MNLRSKPYSLNWLVVYLFLEDTIFNDVIALLPDSQIDGDKYKLKTMRKGNHLFNYSNEQFGRMGMILSVFDGKDLDINNLHVFDAIHTSIILKSRNYQNDVIIKKVEEELQKSVYYSPSFQIEDYNYHSIHELMSQILSDYYKT